MYPNLPDDTLNFLYTLCEKYRQNIQKGLLPANAKRIYVEDFDNVLMLANQLKSIGAVESIDGARYIIISPKALLLEQHFKDCAQNQTENKRQQRLQNKIAILNVLVPLITFLIGIFVEHFTNIVGLAMSLFQ